MAAPHGCEGVQTVGRGRAKAKQTKVARQLKYQSFETNFNELEQELAGSSDSGDEMTQDDYAELARRYGDDGEDRNVG